MSTTSSAAYPHTRRVNMRLYGPMESEKLNNFGQDVDRDLAAAGNLATALQERLKALGEQLKGGMWINADPLSL